MITSAVVPSEAVKMVVVIGYRVIFYGGCGDCCVRRGGTARGVLEWLGPSHERHNGWRCSSTTTARIVGSDEACRCRNRSTKEKALIITESMQGSRLLEVCIVRTRRWCARISSTSKKS